MTHGCNHSTGLCVFCAPGGGGKARRAFSPPCIPTGRYTNLARSVTSRLRELPEKRPRTLQPGGPACFFRLRRGTDAKPRQNRERRGAICRFSGEILVFIGFRRQLLLLDAPILARGRARAPSFFFLTSSPFPYTMRMTASKLEGAYV